MTTMISSRIKLKSFLAVLTACICSIVVSASQGGTSQDAGTSLIATVNGRDVLYAQVRVSDKLARSAFKIQQPGPPSKGELQKIKTELEIGNLRKVIVRSALNLLDKRFSIVVPQAEVSRELDKQSNSINNAARSFNNQSKLLLRALKATDNGESQSSVYKRLLSARMSKEQWELNLAYYKDVQHRAFLEQVAKASPATFRKSLAASVRETLREKKIDKAIDVELAKKDPKFASILQLKAITSEQSAYLTQSRTAWWSDFYHRIVVMKNQRFNSVFQILLNG